MLQKKNTLTVCIIKPPLETVAVSRDGGDRVVDGVRASDRHGKGSDDKTDSNGDFDSDGESDIDRGNDSNSDSD